MTLLMNWNSTSKSVIATGVRICAKEPFQDLCGRSRENAYHGAARHRQAQEVSNNPVVGGAKQHSVQQARAPWHG